MNCVDCKDFTCQHRSENTGGRRCYYESGEQKEKLLTMAAEASLHYIDWSSFRREAAKEILPTLIEKASEIYELESLAKEVWCEKAVEWADELIKRLKDEK